MIRPSAKLIRFGVYAMLGGAFVHEAYLVHHQKRPVVEEAAAGLGSAALAAVLSNRRAVDAFLAGSKGPQSA